MEAICNPVPAAHLRRPLVSVHWDLTAKGLVEVLQVLWMRGRVPRAGTAHSKLLMLLLLLRIGAGRHCGPLVRSQMLRMEASLHLEARWPGGCMRLQACTLERLMAPLVWKHRAGGCCDSHPLMLHMEGAQLRKQM